MKPLFRASYGWLAGCALLLIVLFGCTENLTDPEPPLFAKPGAMDTVLVTATIPDTAPQDTTVLVDVLGDGFDRGSTVDFLAGDLVDPKLKVKNVHYINEKKLTVELEVDSTAEIRLYNVAVTTKRGPRGVGTELFRVVEKTSPSMQEFELTGFQVIEVPHDSAPERCPDLTTACNKIVINYTGSLEALQLRQIRVYDEYFDPSIEDRRYALGGTLPRASEILYPTSSNTLVTYWQGQWQPSVFDDPMGPSYTLPPEPRVAFAPLDEPVAFTFGFSYRDHFFNGIYLNVLNEVPDALAYYRGPAPVGLAYARIDVAGLVTVGKVKKFMTTTLNFYVSAYKDPGVQVISNSLHAFTRVMVTFPGGRRVMVTSPAGTDPPDAPYSDIYKLEVPPAGTCLEVRVTGMEFVPGTGEENWDHRFYAWDPVQDPDGAAPVGLYYDGETITTIPGGCSQ